MSQQSELPIPDFDSAPWGSLQPRLRGLDRAQIELLLDHERAHANRVAYVQFHEQRLGELSAGTSPNPDGGSAAPATPPGLGTQGGSPVSPQTSGPPVNPPAHGVPTNPAQPRS